MKLTKDQVTKIFKEGTCKKEELQALCIDWFEYEELLRLMDANLQNVMEARKYTNNNTVAEVSVIMSSLAQILDGAK